ncbi:hypothetical protein ACFFWC_17520 [Plantactinospora siamensis]|uniref:Lipoprotein n=1 Tax=Plantactinospora siamensis TaxID=555372 RepID=A0ABV6NRE9_9ACTN
MRARPVASAVSLALVAVAALGACGRSEPGVAAYVGDATYSTDRVDHIYTDAQSKFHDAVQGQIAAQAAQSGASPTVEPPRSTVTRQDVVDLLVGIDLGKRVAAEKKIPISDQVTAEQLESDIQMPASAEFAKLWGEWIDIYGTLSEKLPPAELSDQAVMAIYQALVKVGKIPGGMSVTQVRQTFGDGGFVRTTTAVSAALADEAKRIGVTVNPRYRPLGVPAVVSTGSGVILYELPYVDQDGPVIDLAPSAGPSAPAQ